MLARRVRGSRRIGLTDCLPSGRLPAAGPRAAAAGRDSSYSVSWKHYREPGPVHQPTPGLPCAYPGAAGVSLSSGDHATAGSRQPRSSGMTASQDGPGDQMTTTTPPVPALTIDALGRKCPIPIIMLAERIREVPVGSVVSVLADDPAARTDLPAWCGLKSHEFVLETVLPGGWSFLVRRCY